MKKYLSNIFKTLLPACAAVAFVSCDEVAPDDRYVDGGEIQAERCVLLEDFTGQNCVNCPEAHRVIEQLEEQYGDNIIAVSIHSGAFSVYNKQTNFAEGKVYLMCREGQAIMNAYGIQDFPMGVIDMGSPVTYTDWASKVRDALVVPSNVSIDLKAQYVPDEKDGEDGYFGNIEIQADVLSGDARTANLQFWIIESGIVAEQRQLDGSTDYNYVHNNVFRAQVFDGLRGKEVSLNDGLVTTFDGSIQSRWTAAEHWEIQNLAVVAIVSDNTGVLQAKKVALFPKTDENTPE